MKRFERGNWLAAALALLGAGACGGAPVPPAPSPTAPPPQPATSAAPAALPSAATSARSEPVAPKAEDLAKLVRESDWQPATNAELVNVHGKSGELLLLIADFETTTEQKNGMPLGFRRVALFDASAKLLGQVTLKKSEGGADLIEHEQRDVDGDGATDQVMYYSVKDQWNGRNSGWIAALAAGRIVQFPLTVRLGEQHWFFGEGCWASIENVPVHIVVWHESDVDAKGRQVNKSRQSSAVTVKAGGVESLEVFGVSVASGAGDEALQARIPAAHREPERQSELLQPNCSAEPPAFVVVPVRNRWAVLTGLSLTRAGAGHEWPAGTPKPAVSEVVPVSNLDPSKWPTNRDQK